MKGFKPTGYGPSAGFKFPTRMGFTGSTGSITSVSPYVRRKAFADGGFVRQDTPRMKVDSIGDQGSALVRRKKPYAQWQADVGATSSLLPGFNKGGKTRKANGGLAVLQRRRKPSDKVKPPVASTAKEKFAADGGRIVRGSSAKPFGKSALDIFELGSSVARNVTDDIKRRMSSGQRTVEGRNESIDERVSRASNYSRGGKMKRMGYASGGGVSRGEAKKIAQSTVGEHVRYPAPKGHKGLKSC